MGMDAYELPLWAEETNEYEETRQDMEWSGTEGGRVHNRKKLNAAAACNLALNPAAIPYMTAPPDESMKDGESIRDVVQMIKNSSPLKIVPMKLTTIVKYNPDGHIDNNLQIEDMQILSGSERKANETYLDMVRESMQLVEATLHDHVMSVRSLGQRSRMDPFIGYQAPDGVVPMDQTRLLSTVMRRTVPNNRVRNGTQNFGEWNVSREMCVREHTYRHPDIGEYKIPVLHVSVEAKKLNLGIRLVPEVPQVNALWGEVLERMVYRQYVNNWLNPDKWLDLVWNPNYEDPKTQEQKKVVAQFNAKTELSLAMKREIPQNPLIQRHDRLACNLLQSTYFMQDVEGKTCPALELVLAIQPQLQRESDAAIARKRQEDAQRAMEEEEIARNTSERRDREEAGLDDEDNENKRMRTSDNGQENQLEEGLEEEAEDNVAELSDAASSA
jgi:hypothetical protein